MSRNKDPVGVINGVPQLLRANRHIAHALPHPSETWTRQDVPSILAEALPKLQANHVIEVAEHHGAETRQVHTWRTKPEAYRYAQENIEPPTRTPCGHTGVRNLGEGVFTCRREDCDYRFDRDAAREVLEA